jgi:hypothetical protein
MAKSKTMSGARAKVYIDNVLVGIFENCSYNKNLGTEPVYLLGRFSAAEIAITSYEVVTVNCSGFRLIGNGAHKLPKVPKLQDLLNFETITLTVIDRQSPGTQVFTVRDCVPNTEAGGYAAKALSRVQITYQGTVASDESGPQDEGDGVNLP